MRLRLAFLLLLLPLPAGAESWRLDPGTTVSVSVPWRGKAIKIQFPEVAGTIDFDHEAPEAARAKITANTARATTGVGVVDAFVRGEAYLDAAEFPEITFQLDRLRRLDKSSARVQGRLTLRGRTRPVAFTATVFHYGPDPAVPGRFIAGFDIAGSVDRADFGSTAGAPEIGTTLPVAIHLLITSN
jgi:polyisoprenoid-binding protein YceI